MRAIIPVFFVILGLGANDFAGSRLSGGLADADPHDMIYLAGEGAITCFEHAPPSAQHLLHELFSNQAMRGRRNSPSRHIHYAPRRATFRTNTGFRVERGHIRLRGPGQRDRVVEVDHPAHVMLVSPVEKVSEAATRRREKGAGRRR